MTKHDDTGPVVGSDVPAEADLQSKAPSGETVSPRESPPARRPELVFALAAALLVTVGAYVLRPRGVTAAFDVMDLRVEHGIGSANVRWRSTRSYPSIVELSGKDLNTLRVDGSCASDGEHRVHLTGLRPGRAYDFTIILPCGKRLVSRPLRLKPFFLTPTRLVAKAGRLQAWWSASLPARCVLSVRCSDATTIRKSSGSGFALHHNCTVEDLKAPVVEAQIEFRCSAGGRGDQDLASFLETMAAATIRDMADKPEEIVGDLDLSVGNIAEVARKWGGKHAPEGPAAGHRFGRRAKLILAQRLEARNWSRAVARTRPFLPFLLEHRLLAGRSRVALRASLAKVLLVQGGAAYSGTSLPDDAVPSLGFFHTRHSSGLGCTPLAEKTLLQPVTLSSFKPLRNHPRKYLWSFPLARVKADPRIEVTVDYECWYSSIYLVATLNDGPPNCIWRLRGVKNSRAQLYVGLIGSALRKGDNTLCIEPRLLPGCIDPGKIIVYGLALRVE